MANERECVEALLEAGLDDWVSLDEVTWEVTRGDLSPANKATVLRVLELLFFDGLMIPGNLGEAGFEDWLGDPQGWMERALAELERLAWKPMGAGFWLRLTGRGEAASGSAGAMR